MNEPLAKSSTNELGFEKIKLLVSFVKWLIGTAVLAYLTMIINNSFKERTIGIKEMQAFDKYVEIILKANNIEERWKLSDFLSTVTPTERLRERWVEYKQIITADYNTFKELKVKEEILKEKVQKNQSPEAISDLNEIKKQLEPFQRTLIRPEILNKTKATDDELSDKLKNFKTQFAKKVVSDSRYSLIDYFNEINSIYNSVVKDLHNELGKNLFSTIQTGISRDYDSATFSNKYGVLSRVDPDKKIHPELQAKFTEEYVIVTMSENDKKEVEKYPLENMQWEEVRLFIKEYFVKRLGQLE